MYCEDDKYNLSVCQKEENENNLYIMICTDVYIPNRDDSVCFIII